MVERKTRGERRMVERKTRGERRMVERKTQGERRNGDPVNLLLLSLQIRTYTQ